MNELKILLVGADGHMGAEVIKRADAQESLRIVAGISKENKESIPFPLYRTIMDVQEAFDLVIDFSNPVLLDNILEGCSQMKKPVVIATTGYSEEEDAKIEALSQVVPVFKSANMSLGLNLMAKLSQIAATVLYPDFDIEIVEAHHRRKKDAASGTALLLANAIRDSLKDQTKLDLVYDRSQRNEARPVDEIGMSVIRGGNIVGEHDVYFAGNGEVITLKHSALSRDVFADGAIRAARFLIQQDAGLYDMTDLLQL